MPDLLLQEIAAGEGLTLNQLARLMPSSRRGKPVSLSCMVRWVVDGVKLPTGDRVRLEACRLGGRWLSSLAALQRFITAQTPQPGQPPLPRPDRQRNAAAARAARSLAKAGW